MISLIATTGWLYKLYTIRPSYSLESWAAEHEITSGLKISRGQLSIIQKVFRIHGDHESGDTGGSIHRSIVDSPDILYSYGWFIGCEQLVMYKRERQNTVIVQTYPKHYWLKWLPLIDRGTFWLHAAFAYTHYHF